MAIDLDEQTSVRLNQFATKHCNGKDATLEMLRDMAGVFNLRLKVSVADKQPVDFMTGR